MWPKSVDNGQNALFTKEIFISGQLVRLTTVPVSWPLTTMFTWQAPTGGPNDRYNHLQYAQVQTLLCLFAESWLGHHTACPQMSAFPINQKHFSNKWHSFCLVGLNEEKQLCNAVMPAMTDQHNNAASRKMPSCSYLIGINHLSLIN